MNASVASQSKKLEENYKVFLHRDYPELHFLLKSTNNIKTKITHHRVTEDGCIWEGLLLLNAF